MFGCDHLEGHSDLVSPLECDPKTQISEPRRSREVERNSPQPI